MNKIKYPAKVGSMSLIGTGRSRPVPWGNYFWLRDGPRVVNMWAENMEHLVDTGVLADGMIEGYVFIEDEDGQKEKQWFVVADDRVPPEYLYNKFCFTGGYSPELEMAKQMFEIHGDPTYELEEWIDPVNYYFKRGSIYNPKTGIIMTTMVPTKL